MTTRTLWFFFFSSRRRHTRCSRDWSSDVCSSDLGSLNSTAFGRSGWRSGRYAWDTSETLHPRDARGAPLADGQDATVKRRTFLKESTLAAAGIATAGALRAAEPVQIEARRQDAGSILVDPKPLFELSPYLYMRFMEPLGAATCSVETAWAPLLDN